MPWVTRALALMSWRLSASMSADGVLGDGVGSTRGLDHRHPASAASVEIDAVEAGATHGDETNAEVREGVDGVGVGDVVDEEADGVGAGGQGAVSALRGTSKHLTLPGKAASSAGICVACMYAAVEKTVRWMDSMVGSKGPVGGTGAGRGRCRRRARGEGIARRTEIDILTRRVESRTRHAAARGRVEARRAKRKSEWRLTSSQHGRCAVREVRARRWPEADARLTIM